MQGLYQPVNLVVDLGGPFDVVVHIACEVHEIAGEAAASLVDLVVEVGKYVVEG